MGTKIGSITPGKYIYEFQGGRSKAYSYCPVTLSALALLGEEEKPSMLEWVESNDPKDQSMFSAHSLEKEKSDKDVLPLWKGIKKISFYHWAKSRFTAYIEFNSEDGKTVKYADGFLVVEGQRTVEYVDNNLVLMDSGKDIEIPDVLRTSLPGRPITDIIAHPLFHGLKCNENQDDGNIFQNKVLQIKGPDACDDFMAHNFEDKVLPKAMERRAEMLDVARIYFPD